MIRPRTPSDTTRRGLGMDALQQLLDDHQHRLDDALRCLRFLFQQLRSLRPEIQQLAELDPTIATFVAQEEEEEQELLEYPLDDWDPQRDEPLAPRLLRTQLAG